MLKRYSAFLILVWIVGMVGTTNAADTIQHTLTHDGIERTYHVYEPQSEPNHILIALHDFASSGRAMEVVTGLNAIADANGFVVVYPDSQAYYWDDGRSTYGIAPDDGTVDDLGFLAALQAELINQYGLENDDVYLTGIGNGGQMAYTTACLQPNLYGGIIVVSSLLWSYEFEQCSQVENPSPIDLFIVHGSHDEFYESNGKHIEYSSGTQHILGDRTTLRFFAERNGCDPQSRTNSANILTYSDCSAMTTLVTIPNSGGQWHRTDGLEFNDFGFDTNEFIAAVMTNGDWEGLIPTEATSDETPRTFRLFIPNSYDEETPIPLVIGLHGKTANANHQAWTSDFNSIAEREGIITLYPEGLNTEWNYIRGMPPGYEGIGAYDDEEFLLSLLDYISSELNIDRNRVYVTGLSNGGFMTQRLACTQQEHFAAFASVAATGTYELPGFCEGKGAVPIMYIQGTADRIVPWDGMQTQSRSGIPFWISLPMNDTMAFWAFHNECRTDELDIEDIPSVDDETRSRIIRVVDCLDYAPVQLIMVANGGHVWPGVRDIQSDLLGISTKDFNATEMIWEFFQDKSLDDRP